MSIADTDALAAALEGGDVPAQVGFPSFAGHLINNAKIVFEEPDLREAFTLMCAASTGLKTGAGMDIPPAFSTFISTAAGKLAKWIRNTSAEAVGDTVNDNTRLLDALDTILGNEHREAKNTREDKAPIMLGILTGSKEELERSAHAEPRVPLGNSLVDWAAATTPGKLRDFFASLARAVYFHGNTSATTRLLNVLFGSGYMGDSNTVSLIKGAKTSRHGAIAGFLYAGSPAAATLALRNWEILVNMGTPEDEQRPVISCQQVFSMVNIIPDKYASEESYSLRLGDNFVSDALISKLAVGVQHAAVHAAQDGDPAKAAKVVGMALQLVSSDDKNHNSHMHWRTVGELGTRALGGNTVDGRNYPMYVAKAHVIRASLYIFLDGLDDGESARESVATLVAAKLSLSKTEVEVAAIRTQRNAPASSTRSRCWSRRRHSRRSWPWATRCPAPPTYSTR